MVHVISRYLEILECSHIEAKTKWQPFRRQHIQKHFLHEDFWISTTILLKFIPKGPIDDIPALFK